MKIHLSPAMEKDSLMMRDAYARTLMELAASDGRVLALDADLMNSMSMKTFEEQFPDRTFNCGVQEANMIGVAAGLSAVGFIPFAHTFGPFATRRCYDQIFISAAYAGLNVKIIGSDPGITAAFNGGTHMPFEDMGIMREIPDVTLLEPVDNVMLHSLLPQVKNAYGVCYIRLMRRQPVMIYAEGSEFEIGKGVVLRDGEDVTLITSGVLTADTLRAADQLRNDGIGARVVNLFTWKPVDRELVESCAAQTGAVVTVENHSIVGGLGSAVAETLAETYPVPMERVGCLSRFGEVGSQEYLQKAFQMTPKDIIEKTLRVLKRKRRR